MTRPRRATCWTSNGSKPKGCCKEGDADLDDALGLGDAEDDGDQFPGNAELDEEETI